MNAPYLSLIEWPRPFFELYEFVGSFLALGAIGFRYTSLRGRLGNGPLFERMARRAGVIGLVGAVLGAAHLIQVLPRLAQRARLPVGSFLTTPGLGSAGYYLMALALVGFALAAAGKRIGWPLAAIGIIAGLLRSLFVGQFERLITPMHVLAGGLWIGTLFVLVVAGIGVLMRHEGERDARGNVVADLVNAFSPLALVCGLGVVTFGVLAALRELEPLSALWTTAYGYTLIGKLCIVALVFGLGAWNWRRQRPTLGSEAAAHSIRRSATFELIAATLVLLVTSIMLSLPEPH